MRTHALIGTAWLALVGCYSPELRDCTVTCTAADECADDQVCTGGLCRTQGATCGDGSGSNPAKVQLRVEVIGEGMVVVAGIGTCASDDGNDDCTWLITVGRQVQLDAMVLDDKEFERWTTENCAHQEDTSCTLTATSALLVGAKFE